MDTKIISDIDMIGIQNIEAYESNPNQKFNCRIRRYNVKYMNNKLLTPGLEIKMINQVDKLDLNCSDKMKAYIITTKEFDSKGLSIQECYDRCLHRDAVSLSLKYEYDAANETMDDLISYSEDIRECSYNLFKLIQKFKRLEEIEPAATDLILTCRLYLKAIMNMMPRLYSMNIEESCDINMIHNESIYLEYNEIISEDVQIKSVMAHFKAILNSILDIAVKSGIQYSIYSKKLAKWKEDYKDKVNDSFNLVSNVSDPKDKNNKPSSEDKNKKSISLTYFDANVEATKNLLKNISEFYNTTPAFTEITDVSHWEDKFEEMMTKDNESNKGLSRVEILKVLRIKDDENKSLSDLVLNHLKTAVENKKTITNGEILSHFEKILNCLKLAETLNKKAKRYSNTYETKIKNLSERIEREAKSDEAKSKMEENKPTDVSKEEVKDLKKVSKSDADSKFNQLTQNYINKMNMVVALTQSLYTVIYTTIKEIDSFYSKNEANGVKSEKKNVETKGKDSKSLANNGEEKSSSFNSKDKIVNATKK